MTPPAIGAADKPPVSPPPPPTQPAATRPSRWLAAGAWAAVFAAVGTVAFVNPAESVFLPRCPFHSLTNLNCPGCGATRALYRLLHGQFLAALRCNAFLVLALPSLLYGLASFTREAFTGRELPMPSLPPRWIYAFIVAVVLFSILRNIPAVPFTYLSPP